MTRPGRRRAAPEVHVHLEVIHVRGLTATRAEAAVAELCARVDDGLARGLGSAPGARAGRDAPADTATAVRRALVDPGRLSGGA